MILPNEFLWLESYLHLDDFFFTDSLNWDAALSITLNNTFGLNFIFDVMGEYTYLFLSAPTNFSILDFLFFFETDRWSSSRSLFIFFILDLNILENVIHPQFNFIYFGDSQNLATLLPYIAPELFLAYQNFLISTFLPSIFGIMEAQTYDFFYDAPSIVLSEVFENFFIFSIWFWVCVLFFSSLIDQPTWNALETYWTRLYFYIVSLSLETRMQLDMGLQVFFTFVFYWLVAIASFDDDQEEMTENFNLALFCFFILLVSFLVYKYSIHYFAFLEATDNSGRSVSFLTKQFFRDFMGTIGLALRFFILLFRLNVYDNLDDFYDSYYIFLGDFNEIEYLLEILLPIYHLALYEADNKGDALFLMEEENGLLIDLFHAYWILWGKFFFFVFFIIEELFRVALALYISYLIIFEVHAANCTYNESNYFLKVRARGFSRGPFSYTPLY